MGLAIVMLAYLLGTVSGALWAASLERGGQATDARLYFRLMIFFYLSVPIILLISDLMSWIVALPYDFL